MAYSRSPKNSTLQLSQKSSKSACSTPQRPIWNTFGTVVVWDFWENGCTAALAGCLLDAECGSVGNAAGHPEDGEGAVGGAGDGLAIDGGGGRRWRPGAATRRRNGSPWPKSVWGVRGGRPERHGARPCRRKTVDKQLYAEGTPVDLAEPVVRVGRHPPSRRDAFGAGQGGGGHGT